MTRTHRLLVIGGNGFTGSAVCRSAVARGWQVVSLSRSGKPYATAQGHSPSWVDKVEWKAGTPFAPATYEHLLPSCTAVVSTLGILFESDYKTNGRVDPFSVVRNVAERVLGGRGNPLKKKPVNESGEQSDGGSTGGELTYERMNRDAALAIFRAFSSSTPDATTALSTPSVDSEAEAGLQEEAPFVYLSAEDIFRPFISSRYISTKREAERTIEREVEVNGGTEGRKIRPIFIRPSLIYHPIINSFTTLPATALSASSHIQSVLPTRLQLSHLFPSAPSSAVPGSPTTSTDIPSATASLASLLTIPPIHVDTVAEAICKSIEDQSVRGVVDVRSMRRMMAFDDVFDSATTSSS